MARQKTEAVTEKLGKEDSRGIGEIGRTAPIERVSENDFAKDMDLEAFMHQELTIVMASGSGKDEWANPVEVPSVNTVNQPIIRGAECRVKRKYVEALARCRYTDYEQNVHDSSKPENIQMEPVTSLCYPFTVIEDPHPNGREWLKAILAEK